MFATKYSVQFPYGITAIFCTGLFPLCLTLWRTENNEQLEVLIAWFINESSVKCVNYELEIS